MRNESRDNIVAFPRAPRDGKKLSGRHENVGREHRKLLSRRHRNVAIGHSKDDDEGGDGNGRRAVTGLIAAGRNDAVVVVAPPPHYRAKTTFLFGALDGGARSWPGLLLFFIFYFLFRRRQTGGTQLFRRKRSHLIRGGIVASRLSTADRTSRRSDIGRARRTVRSLFYGRTGFCGHPKVSKGLLFHHTLSVQKCIQLYNLPLSCD